MPEDADDPVGGRPAYEPGDPSSEAERLFDRRRVADAVRGGA